jgi:transposase-like protein
MYLDDYEDEYCLHCGRVRAVYTKRFVGYISYRCASCDREIDCEFLDDDEPISPPQRPGE